MASCFFEMLSVLPGFDLGLRIFYLRLSPSGSPSFDGRQRNHVHIQPCGVVDQAGDEGLGDGGRDPGQDEHQCGG